MQYDINKPYGELYGSREYTQGKYLEVEMKWVVSWAERLTFIGRPIRGFPIDNTVANKKLCCSQIHYKGFGTKNAIMGSGGQLLLDSLYEHCFVTATYTTDQQAYSNVYDPANYPPKTNYEFSSESLENGIGRIFADTHEECEVPIVTQMPNCVISFDFYVPGLNEQNVINCIGKVNSAEWFGHQAEYLRFDGLTASSEYLDPTDLTKVMWHVNLKVTNRCHHSWQHVWRPKQPERDEDGIIKTTEEAPYRVLWRTDSPANVGAWTTFENADHSIDRIYPTADFDTIFDLS